MSKKKKESGKSTTINLVTGILDISRSGTGFVDVEGMDRDILIKPQDIGRAFDGDIVRVEIPLHLKPGKRVEGKVVDIASRKQKDFSGLIEIKGNVAFFIPASDKQIPDFYIPMNKLAGVANGDRVVARFVKWEKGDRRPEGEVLGKISAENEADFEMKEILIENGFPLQFEPQVLEIANNLSDEITEQELRKRRDCRDVLTFTIDPVDAKDFDDALSIKYLDNGNLEIGVHIADVSHFVTPGSELDQAAYQRATSVYLPDRVNPMLPERISNELCSLRPNEDKYCFSAIYEMTPKGKIKDTWIGRTVIHSNHRYTYEEVQEIIESKKGLHEESILLLDKVAKSFRKERFKKGAINFSSQEVRFVLDDNGKPIGIVVKESKDAHQLIEEFMLLANRSVAEFVSRMKVEGNDIPFPYRVHDSPDEEKLVPFVAFAKKFGYKFNTRDDKAIAESFNSLLEEVQGKPEQHVLEQLGIRTMAKAAYDPANIGHYGLGFEHYSHFTSPIRRYPDVMVHRIVQECLDGRPQLDKKMKEKCKHCSERERAAMDSERSANKYKQVEFLKDHLGEDFDAVISGVASFGFWAETVDHKCEGLISVKDLVSFDVFRHEEGDYQLVGINTGQRFRIGDKVRIKVVAANLEKRQLDFDWIPEGKMAEKAKYKTKK